MENTKILQLINTVKLRCGIIFEIFANDEIHLQIGEMSPLIMQAVSFNSYYQFQVVESFFSVWINARVMNLKINMQILNMQM